MRIRSKVALVGGIPITIAAAIAATAWFLLSAAETAREGAVMAGAIYRDLLEVKTARNDYIQALPQDRARHAAHLANLAESGLTRLGLLSGLAHEEHADVVQGTRAALIKYRDRMQDLTEITTSTDRMIAEMSTRAASLIELSDKARQRQHDSNTDIIESLTEKDRKLRLARDIVDRAHELRAAIAAAAVEAAKGTITSFALARVGHSAKDLLDVLRMEARDHAATELVALLGTEGAPRPELAEWVEQLIKIHSTEQRSLHDEVAQLLTYTVSAAETEQATQTIAITVLKLERRTSDLLESRNVAAADEILDESGSLVSTLGSLPLSPLIQSEMISAIEHWREGLAVTSNGLRSQNELIAELNTLADTMVRDASALNDRFASDADRIGRAVRTILLLGAAVGLLLGAGTALVVARSITHPLRRLQETMLELAASPNARPIPEAARRDELGAMARAVNFFVKEISRREEALRLAKEQADTTLVQLRETQSNLIQAEKLASLGQLVAGVAHEINTPLGVALTTSTVLEREVNQLGSRVDGQTLSRSEFKTALTRLDEGSRLLLANLKRAIDLVYSFKQVAADQASGERRRFDVKIWLDELLTSLGPVLRKSGHQVVVECPPDLVLDTYPGSLAQVLTNLVMNATVHAFEPGQHGELAIRVTERRGQAIRLIFSDDGKGIGPEHLPRIFDPFFTTGRDRGSTGLGLHIVYNLVTARLHGTIEVESCVAQGTRFTIDLPMQPPDPPPERTAPRMERLA
jgi:signal transduction histidine kinase